MENAELTHHGILGMKWGVRRYQNKDGTLTARGKKRYSAEMEKLKKEETVLKNKQRTQAKVYKLLKKRQELDEMKRKMSGEDDDKAVKAKTVKVSDKPKRIEDMTDDELAYKINRLRLEQTYKALSPQTKTKGEEFLDKYLKPAGKKLTDKLGDTILDKVNKELRDKFGLDADEKTLKKLKKEFEEVDYKKKIAESKAAIKKAEGGESDYDRLKREAEIAGFETRIRNNENAKKQNNDTNFNNSTVKDVPEKTKNAGKSFIDDIEEQTKHMSIFDYLEE